MIQIHPFLIVITNWYPKQIPAGYRPNQNINMCLGLPLEKMISQLFGGYEKLWFVGDTSGFIQNPITPTYGMPYQKEKP